MYERHSLSELGELSKRHDEEFGEIIKEWKSRAARKAARATSRAWRAEANAKGANLRPIGRIDTPPIGERVAAASDRAAAAGQQRVRTVLEPVQNLATSAENMTGNVRSTAASAQQAVAEANQTIQNAGQTINRAGNAGRNIGFGLGAAGLGTGAFLAGYAHHDAKRKGGNVERDSRGRLRLSAKGKQAVGKREEPTRQEKREAKSLAAHNKRIAGIKHNTGEQNYRPGLTAGPFTHTEVRRDSTVRRVLRPTAGYLIGGAAGRSVDALARAATKGRYKTKFGHHVQGKIGRWGGRLVGTSAGFTQNMRSGDVEAFRRSTGEQPRIKAFIPMPITGRAVVYAGSKPPTKE